MTLDALTLPLDPASTAALAASGLDYRRVDLASDAFLGFIRAVSRGFLGGHPSDEQIEGSREAMVGRRLTGIYDGAAVHPDVAVATIDSWVAELTTEPGRTLAMWSISGVTVSPTHRRRGIARAMIEGELRTAADAGIAIAGLTVSEATIYGRFGFSPAVYVTSWELETARARWIGPRPAGRLDAVERETLRDDLALLHERIRLASPGQVEGWPGLWRRLAGLAPGQDDAKKVRGVRYTDGAGEVRGALAYSISEHATDFTKNELHISALMADGDDAYAALWRFALEHDLVATVKAELASTDEPLRWMIADQRGARVTESEHHWLRILDVPRVLAARSYRVPGAITLRVHDDLGPADGVWLFEVDAEGAPVVTEASGSASANVDVTLSVGALSSIVLGGVRASTLRGAGLVAASRETAAWLDLAFAPLATPRLTLWY